MKRTLLAGLSVLALMTSAPAIAQNESSGDGVEDAASEEEVFAALGEMFAVEPLTAEQEARLPQARAIVEKIVPPGSMGEMMGSMFDGMLGPIFEMAGEISTGDAARLLGREAGELELDEAQAREVALLIDPALDERNARMKEALPRIIGQVMTALEPAMKTALTEVYAVYFDQTELTDIDAFFSTPSGASYARQSMKMATDPRYLSSMMQAMPSMMGSFTQMEAEMEALTADLPEQRAYADLDPAERQRLEALTGLSQEEIEEGMASARAARDADEGHRSEE
ncbi:hypothetical protein [Qipengyuania sp. MTN3-11]|uniref:hypothetical protein n=1 Tax=Qipengyuania sp. MTN3-11 TaxID=3056557 RepID=UPI0036F2FECA